MSIFRRWLTKAAQGIASGMIQPSNSTSGVFGDCPYQQTTLNIGQEKVSQIVIDLPSTIGGTIQITPVGVQALWDNSKKLESIEFNKKIKVYTSSRSLAFQVLSPDFMAWFMDLTVIPQLFIMETKCFVAFFGENVASDQQLVIAKKILDALRHSGALDPAPL